MKNIMRLSYNGYRVRVEKSDRVFDHGTYYDVHVNGIDIYLDKSLLGVPRKYAWDYVAYLFVSETQYNENPEHWQNLLTNFRK